MLSVQDSPSNPLQKLLSHISRPLPISITVLRESIPSAGFEFFFPVVEYLSKLYCICVVWTVRDINQIPSLQTPFLPNEASAPPTNFGQLVWFNVSDDQNDVKEKVRSGINAGCQVEPRLERNTLDYNRCRSSLPERGSIAIQVESC